jgi:hypothetical protein
MKKPTIGEANMIPKNSAENVREYYRRQGEERERERIIELLKQMQVTALDTETNKGSQTAWVLENIIVLIKGQSNV